jgi:hypothetical protein
MTAVLYGMGFTPDFSPRAGDVWRTKSGAEYHVLPGYSSGLRLEHATEKSILTGLTIAQLEDMSPVLVYRKP